MQWSDPATLRALDPRAALWNRPPDSFARAARRILGPAPEAVEEAVNLSLSALTIAIEVLTDLVPEPGIIGFGESVRAMRADPELRGRFKALYATRSAPHRKDEFPGVPTMLTDPFCLESRPTTYWFDAETCEEVVSAFIARQTLNRRRALLNVHESGVRYSLRGLYRGEEKGLPTELRFLTSEDAEYRRGRQQISCRYYVHPLYEHRKSVRKLVGAEVVLDASTGLVLDIDLQTGNLFDCFADEKLTPSGGQTTNAPHLFETPLRVETLSETEATLVGISDRDPSNHQIVNHYTFSLIKRATFDPDHQVALNRALTHYFKPGRTDRFLPGWTQRYDAWIGAIVGDLAKGLTRTPEEKTLPANGLRIDGEGPFLNALLAIWLQAQIHLSDLPTDVETYLRANTPRSFRDLAPETDGAKPTWPTWAKTLPPGQGFAPKQLLDSWATVWKLLEIVLQHHNDEVRSRITYSEFVEAMPVKVYANYESEFETLKRQAPELAEMP